MKEIRDAETQAVLELLEAIRKRGMTAETVTIGATTLTGLRYPLTKKSDDGSPVTDEPDDDDLTFASAGG